MRLIGLYSTGFRSSGTAIKGAILRVRNTVTVYKHAEYKSVGMAEAAP